MCKVLLFIFIAGCSNEIEQTVCYPSDELSFEDFNDMCSASTICVTGNSSEYIRHLCFCDIICLCFHSRFYLSDSCENVLDKGCQRNNMLMLFNGEFCSLSKEQRENLMNSFRLQSSRLKEELNE